MTECLPLLPNGLRSLEQWFGFEFETEAGGAVRCYWKEGINVGVSGALGHYPEEDLTFAVQSNSEDGAWEPVRMIDRVVSGVNDG